VVDIVSPRTLQVAIPRPVAGAPDRDEAQLGPVALITDRGYGHDRNEDAAAAGIVGNVIAVAVCDGVSSSTDGQKAAAAASTAGVDAMLVGPTGSRTARAAVFTGLARAAQAAAECATQTGRASGLELAPSCTYTAAVVVPTSAGTVEITVGNVGDSRVYWLPDPPGTPQQLTVDDSVAQEFLTAGFSASSDAVQRGAHTLTRWLGADNDETPWSESSVRTITATGSGSLLLCSDGLWNYLPEAVDIIRFVTGSAPDAAARALTDYALAAGGLDNITVVVIPIGYSDE
jgi:serine/threonine protein phosphatase PrpC